MKKSEIVFSSVMVPLDYFLLVLAGLSAYFIRYSRLYTENVREVVFSLSFPAYLKLTAAAAFFWIIIFALSGLYSMRPARKIFDLFNKIFLACSTGALALILTFFFTRELFSSRFIILAAWILSVIYVSLAHFFSRWLQILLYFLGIGVHRVILIGADETSAALAGEIMRNPRLGYEIVLRYPCPDRSLTEAVAQLSARGKIDEIIQADPNLTREETLNLMDLANDYHLDFKYAVDLLGAKRTNIDIKTINGIPLVEIKKTPLDGWGRLVKRIFDIIGSFVALTIIVPFFPLIAAIIKIDSPGPVFYRPERVGARAKKFRLCKFRSMIVGAEKMKRDLQSKNERSDGPLFKMTADPRVTSFGRWLRRLSVDEWPNFWNVLIGHMSLVGPRPHEPAEVEKYKKHHRKLLNIKPGITGMAQVSGRSTLNFETEVKLDILYIETWSLKLDVIILLKTPWVVFFSRTAS